MSGSVFREGQHDFARRDRDFLTRYQARSSLGKATAENSGNVE
jgi:hypothetical protein